MGSKASCETSLSLLDESRDWVLEPLETSEALGYHLYTSYINEM